jgi:iron complex transport system substrate-binding protein
VILLALLLAAGPRQHLGPTAPERAQRVVTLAPSLSEMVLALGGQDRLVGVTRFDDDPRTARLPRIGGYNDPQPEAVLAVKPDLVLAEPAPANRGPVETLARLGVPVEAFPLSTVADIEAALEGIAGLLGVAQRGAALTAELEAARAEARKAVQGKPRVRTLLVFGLDPLVVAGRRSFAGELLEDAGGENAADSDKPFFRLSAETAVRAAPQLVVLCGVESPAGRTPVPGLEKARVATLRSSALLHPGPRLPQALQDLAAALRQ